MKAVTGFNHTILQVIPRLGSGGAERTTVEIASAIVEAGGRALVVSQGGRLADEIARAGAEVIAMPVHRKDPVSIWANAGKLHRLIKGRGVDLIHARSRAPAWSAMLAAKRTGIPFVTTFHGAHSAKGPFKRWYNSVLVKGEAVIANSHYTAQRIAADYDLAPALLTIIQRGADLRRFSPQAVSADRGEMVNAHFDGENPCDAVRFLLPARLTPWKGQGLAIDAAAILKTKVNAGKALNLKLVLCGGAQGSSAYEADLRARIDERGVRDMVQLVGEYADMPAAYAWSDAVIAPSLRAEPFGRVAVEAGAMGKPVIASAAGGFLETIVDDETGVLFESGNADALASAMERLATDESVRRRMGAAGAARVSALYSAEAMCDATLQVYRKLLVQKV